jgi:Chlorophyll A-B binding protein
LKHGRAAMIATVGYAFEKFGITFDKVSPHEYLSITQGVKFADLAAMSPLDAIKAVPLEGLAQIFMTIAAIEIYHLTHHDGEIKVGETVAPGLQIKVDDRRCLVELQNGRAAMFAVTACLH